MVLLLRSYISGVGTGLIVFLIKPKIIIKVLNNNSKY